MRVALVLIFGAMTAIAGWWTFFLRERVIGHELELKEREAQIAGLTQDLESSRARVEVLGAELREKERRIAELEFRLQLLKVDHRVARIEVLEQIPLPGEPEKVETTVRFVELGQDGEELGGGQVVRLEGETIYLETLVIKFEDDYVEGGDFLRGTSVCLFKRLFSEKTPPEAGTAIDSAGSHPVPYASEGDSESDLFHGELWERFWDYADDPEAAAAKGVRALHGEAPFVRARPGRTYRVELRASGGLTIRPE